MSVKLMGRVWELDVTRDEANILLALADHAHDDGTRIFPTVDYLAWKTRYCERAVQYVLSSLRAKGILEAVAFERGGARPVEYVLHLDKADKREPYGCKDCTGENIARVQKTTEGVQKTTSSYNIEPLKNRIKREGAKSRPRTPRTPISEDYKPSPRLWAWVAKKHPSLDAEAATDDWLNAMLSDTERFKFTDHDRAWQKGMDLAAKWQAERKHKNGNGKRTGYEAFGDLAREAADLDQGADSGLLSFGRPSGATQRGISG